MLRKRKFGLLIGIVAVLALLASACGGRDDDNGGDSGDGGDGGGGDKNVSIAYIPWDEDIAVSNLFKYALEENGYTVDLQQADVGPIYKSVADGSVDLFLDAWLPSTHEDYWAQYGDQIDDLGVWYEGATLNIAVPAYMDDINSLEDLKDNADEFDGNIVGIEPSAGLTRITEQDVIPDYELDMTLQKSSTTAMLTELDKAIGDEAPIVVTLWHPHWAYAAYDLKDLEDPKGSLGEGEELHFLGRQGFAEDQPEVGEVMKNFKMTDAELASLENMIQDAGKNMEADAVKQWADENKEFMDKMFGPLESAG